MAKNKKHSSKKKHSHKKSVVITLVSIIGAGVVAAAVVVPLVLFVLPGQKNSLTYTNINESTNTCSISGCSDNFTAHNFSIPSSARIDGRDYTVNDIGQSAFAHKTKITGTLSIPASIRTIEDKAFNYTGITTVFIPATVLSFYSAFAHNKQLTTITLNETRDYSTSNPIFEDCANLTTVLYGMTPIVSPGAFNKCVSLRTFTTKGNLTSIGSSSFRDCRALTSINLKNDWAPVVPIPQDAFTGAGRLETRGTVTANNADNLIEQAKNAGLAGTWTPLPPN